MDQSSSASSSKITYSDTTSSSSASPASESKSDPTSRGSATSSTTTKASSTGPTITSSTALITATITQPPAGFSAVTLSGTTYPSNTWITTTDKDDHTTIIPVIVFGGGPPIIMWGVPPTPNVQFSFPKLPKFHLPCIKVFGVSVGSCSTDPVTDGPPDGEDNPDDPTKTDKTTEKTSTTKKTSTTDECSSTSTVSDCEVRCAKTTSSNSCASYSTTCSETKTGCSVTGTVTTITSSTSSCSTCGSCMTRGPAGNGGPPAPTDPPIRPDDEEEGASDLRKRDHPRHLQKRAGSASEVKTLGACALATGTVSKLTRPAWPKASGDILNPDSQGKMKAKWSVMSRYDRATGTGPCGTVPTVTRVDAKGFKVASNYQALDGKTKPDNDRLSLDHAYEKSWIKDFLESIAGTSTGGGKLACSDINTFFFPQAKAPQTCQWSLLQPVWNSIASDKNPQYFIAMSQYVNGDGKGSFFQDPVKPLTQSYITDPLYKVANDGKWHWDTGKKAGTTSALDALRDMINKGFERTLIGCVEMKMAPMLDLMDKTNNRIYDELSLIDQRIGLPANQPLFGASNVPKWTTAFGSSGIAGAYKDYMTKNIEPQITLPPKYLTKLWDFIKDGLAEAENLPDVKVDSNDNTKPGKHYPDWQKMKSFADDVDKVYKKSGAYEWEYTFSFQWDRNNKRDEGDAGEEGEGGSDRKVELTCSGKPVSESASATKSGTKSSTSKQASQTTSSGSTSRTGSSSSASKTSSGPSSSKTTSKISSASSSTTSKSSSRSATNSQSSKTSSTKTSGSSPVSKGSSSTTQPPRVTAPSVTIGSSSEKVDKCETGYGSYSMMAKATAPANAKSQRFYVPRADFSGGMDWSVEFVDGFVGDDPKKFDKNKPTDPKTVVASWSVGTSEQKDPVAKGKGGKDMKIEWKAPDKATNLEPPEGTFVELVYVEPVGQQEWGIIAKGGKAACMPDSCNGPPRVVSDDNGKVCKKWPCSTQIVCSDDGPVKPRADCLVIEDGVIVPMWYEVSIVANNFIEDGGAKLKSEEKGCGAMTAWKKHDINIRSKDGSWTAVQEFTFTLPITIGAGCVERAIASAGGPKDLRCGQGTSDWVFIK
ncbi:hypothetical protein PG995_013275 [Apiospora arundinis]